jgi:2-keto-4-pentenoate hydratase/2-oxohepta-3-ene-1,7-dioic acid hydratase in catechol pathway
LRAPDRPEEVLPHGRELHRAPHRTAGGELVAPGAQGDRVLPERRRDHRAGRRDRYPEGLTRELDYELELGIVIGRSGKFFTPDEAADYIAGYLVFNDITARDIQRREMQSGVFSFSKSIDTFCPIGPWIVTKDEIPDPQALAMQLRVNGGVRQEGNTSQMVISIPHLVAYHSAQGYSAGDIITTGTISGVAAVQPNPFDFYLQPGDRIEAEIEGVGVLRNHVVPWSAAHDSPPYSTDLYSSTVG